MTKRNALLIFSILLQGCGDYWSKPDTDTQVRGYFADASDCWRSSTHSEQIKVPTADTVTLIDLPISSDSGAFINCMDYKGHSASQAAKANPQDYLTISGQCLSEARQAPEPDTAYADCVKHSRIVVEPLLK